MDVCGIDPGLETTGYAVVQWNGGGPVIRDAGVCRTDPKRPLADRLAQIEEDFRGILDQWHVGAVGVEQVYSHYKHPRTAVFMGHARGVILSVAGRFGLPVRDFSATSIKRFLTGNGRASKPQVQRAVMSAFGLTHPPEPHDVADALAIAYCAAHPNAATGLGPGGATVGSRRCNPRLDAMENTQAPEGRRSISGQGRQKDAPRDAEPPVPIPAISVTHPVEIFPKASQP